MPREPFKDFETNPDYLGVFGLLETGDGILIVANRRIINGDETTVWDLPGGGVEKGETLGEALHREFREETGLEVAVHELLFVAEGERVHKAKRTGVWRSFFFRIEREGGQLDVSGEPDIVDIRFEAREALAKLLTAPYHVGFKHWLESDGNLHYAFDRWED